MSTLFPTTLDTFLNPGTLTNLDSTGSDPRLRHSAQHGNINDAMASVQAKVGVDFSSVAVSLDYIATLLLMTQTEHGQGVRRDILGQPFPTNVIWYADIGGTTKLVEKQYTYDSKKNIIKVELFLYDGTPFNTLKRTITDIKTLSGPFETSRIRTVT